jgi:hypothetical protein
MILHFLIISSSRLGYKLDLMPSGLVLFSILHENLYMETFPEYRVIS